MGQTDDKHKWLIGSFVSTIKQGLPPGSLHYPLPGSFKFQQTILKRVNQMIKAMTQMNSIKIILVSAPNMKRL